MTVAVISGLVRPLVEGHLPEGIEPRFYTSTEQMLELAPEAEIGWFDLDRREPMIEAVTRAEKLRWLNSIYAGLDFMPLDLLDRRGVTITNGVGINAITIAEYVVMLMLAHAKGYREVVRAQDRHEWLNDSPGKMELAGSRALLLGLGAIRSLITARLHAFDVAVVPVRRSPADAALGPGEWRG
ncbi:MAG: NAD(P)-dependent oxidoreductase, partial [Tsuneonella sp.]